MLSIRRALNPFRNQGSSRISNRLLCGTAREELHTCSLESHSAGFTANGESQCDRSPFLARFFDTSFGSQKLLWGTCSFSSRVGTKLEDSAVSDKIPFPGSIVVDDSDNELISEPDLSEDETHELLDISDAEDDVVKKSEGKGESSGFLMSILASSTSSIPQIVENWVKQGNEISRSEYLFAKLGLRLRQMYVKAFQLSQWWMVNKGDFDESDYATHVDLIAKLHGLHKAEDFIGKIPEGFRTETVYRKLLANSVSRRNVTKSEEVFNKMKNLGFPITCSTYEQLLLMYNRLNKKKIADVLQLMRQDNVKPSPFAYRLLIDAKGKAKDIAGMDKVVEIMKNHGIEPNLRTQAKMAQLYIAAGLEDKAEDLLKQMEEMNDKEKHWAILPLYAALGKADDVKRIWSKCESNPSRGDCIAAIEAWGKLQRIDEAEAVFVTASNKFKFQYLPSKIYAVMLTVYANNKMLSKGKDLVKRMADNGHQIVRPLISDSLVKLYIEAGELDEAVDVLEKAAQRLRIKPMFSSYMAVMDEYAKKGDVHNTEKVFYMRRRAGYLCHLLPYQTLVKAYINGKAFAYGMDERMKGDKVYPNKTMAVQLALVDPFRNTLISELLA